ncbi:MAG: glutathione S-transferase family protein, partial [Leptospiraceae bacterium]|nr:glutathione S-transferase family protein [Leptospiraceae bacterium]
MPESDGGGLAALRAVLSPSLPAGPFAPPVLRHKQINLFQTAAILDYIGPLLGLGGNSPAETRRCLQIQLCILDTVAEIHNLHHPISTALYYEEQKVEALRATHSFVNTRIWKWMDYYALILEQNNGPFLVGDRTGYPDLSLFQLLAGLEYALPRTYAIIAQKYPRLMALRSAVGEIEGIQSYLSSERRLPFNQDGLFRFYAELDLEPEQSIA